ncbi:MAG: class I SAM-dependent methyltransferase [Burkholderiales bacterium]|nr:class I SAM-dependent methyltransferase [Burkholderiales bacterium]
MSVSRRRLVSLSLALFAVACGSGARAPDIHYEPTPPAVVESMMRLAAIRPGDVVYDLGCGDGRTVIAAVKAGAARGVCVDIDPERIRESRANAEKAGVAGRIRFLERDLFTTDFSDATVVILFLWPDLNLKLRPQLFGQLEPGARVVSYVHDMGDWSPGVTMKVKGFYGERNLYLWHMPPRQRN